MEVTPTTTAPMYKPQLRATGHGLVVAGHQLRQWVFNFILWVKARPKQRGIGLIVMALLVVVIGSVLYQVTRPPMVTGDYKPFSSKQEYDQFYKTHPLMTKQAPSNAHFYYKASISPNKQAVYQISLFAPAFHPTRANDMARFINDLRKSQREAKNWMALQGEDVSKDYIIWDPDPDILANPTPTQPPLPNKSGSPTSTPTPSPTPSSANQPRFPQ